MAKIRNMYVNVNVIQDSFELLIEIFVIETFIQLQKIINKKDLTMTMV